MRRSRGFALLEALVALVIVAGVGAALFALINTGLENLAKAEAHVATTSVQPQILAWVKSADLSELPENHESSRVFQTSAGEIEARAEYQRFQGPTFAVTGSGAMGIHQVALYNVRVSLYLGSRRLEDILTRRVASKQVFDEPTL